MSIITDLIKEEPSELQHYKVDQKIICTKDILNLIKNIKEKPQITEFENYSLPYMYLPNGEPQNLEERKNLLKWYISQTDSAQWIPESKIQFDILDNFNENIKSECYTDEAAEEKYLNSKPISFLILSKPNIGEIELAKMIGEMYKCVIITPESLIIEEISSDSRVGKCIHFNLKNGRAIGADVFLRLLERRIKTQSAQHRGYVIAGFPLIPNKNYKEDPLSSESAVFNVHEIFDEIVTTNLRPESASTMKGSKISLEEEMTEETKSIQKVQDIKEDKTKKKKVKPTIDLGSENTSIITSSSFSYFSSITNQIKFLFDIFKKPYIFIYLMCENLDVINKISTYRFNLIAETEVPNFIEVTATEFSPDLPNLDVPEEDVFDYKNNVRLPIHFEKSISDQLVEYKYSVLSIINKNILTHDPQNFIKIDGRLSPYKMFNSVLPRLRCLGIQPVIIPQFLIEPEIEGEFMEEEPTEYKSLQEAFAKLRNKGITNRMFKWHLSNWGYKCPVALKNGLIKEGITDFAIRFMNKIYFLSDEKAVTEFYRNPRPFLLPAKPKPIYRIYIMGPKMSGKTVVAKCLSYILNCIYLHPNEMETAYVEKKNSEFIDKLRNAAIAEAIKLLQENRQREREEKVKIWVKSTIALLKTEFTDLAKESYLKLDQMDSSKDFGSTISVASLLSEQTKMELNNELQLLHIPLHDEQKIAEFFLEPEKLLPYLPDDLRKSIKPPTVFDQFVTDYVNEVVNNAEIPEYELSEQDIYYMYQLGINNAENEYFDKNGWVIDGFPADIDILQILSTDEMANEIIYLDEVDTEKPFLRKKFENKSFNEYNEIRDYLKNKCTEYGSNFTDKTDVGYFQKKNLGGNSSSDIIKNDEFSNADEYEEYLQDFSEKWKDVRKYFLNNYPYSPIEIDVGTKTMTEVLNEAVSKIQSRYRLKASIYTQEEKAEEISIFGNIAGVEEEIGEGEPLEDNFQENRRLGDTNIYCPIAFQKYFVLWKGKDQYSAKFQEKIYLLSSQEALDDFLINSYDYIFEKPPNKIPPMRILLIGAIGTGKTTLGKQIAEHFGLFYFNFDEQLLDFLNLDPNKQLEEYLEQTEPAEVEIIQSYLNDANGSVPAYILNAILKSLWTQNPFKETGFLIDSFPRKMSDVTYMIENFLIPDIVLEIFSGHDSVMDRLVGIKMEKWIEEMEKKKKIHDEELDKQIKEWEIEYNFRVEENLQTLAEERKKQFFLGLPPNPPQSSPIDSITNLTEEFAEEEISTFIYDPEQRDEDLENIKIQILEDFPKPETDVVWETYDETLAKMENYIHVTYNKNIEDLNTVRTKFTDENIDYLVFENKGEISHLLLQMFKKLEKYKFRNRSLFERVYSIGVDSAEKLLEQGYYFLSKFGKTCPVQVYEKINPIQMYLNAEHNVTLYPMIHRRYIYFICSETNKIKFQNDPLKYIENSDYELPLLPIKFAIIGPPKCGKTYLAEKIQKALGLKMITRGQASRYVMKYLKFCELAKNMDRVLRKGWAITEEMMGSAVQAVTFDGKSIAQGYVMVGFPNSFREMKCLEELDIIPHFVVELTSDLNKIKENIANETVKSKLVVYSYEFIKKRYDVYMKETQNLKKYLYEEYQNLIELSTPMNKWKQWEATKNIIFDHVFQITDYYKNKNIISVFALKSLLITPEEFIQKQGDYMHYCPCCLFYNGFLINGGIPPDRKGVVQFKESYYWICDEHYQDFINKPTKFLPPHSEIRLPDNLPVKTNQICYSFHEEGLCIVTFWDNQPRSVFVNGETEFKIWYKEQCYIFCTEECMNKFLKEPHKYCDRKIHFRNPNPLSLSKLPTLGYLEQHVAKLLCEVIMETERLRPIHPYMDVAKSAALYIGLLLKYRNPKTNPEFLPLYAECIRKFNERIEQVKEYLRVVKMVFTVNDNIVNVD